MTPVWWAYQADYLTTDDLWLLIIRLFITGKEKICYVILTDVAITVRHVKQPRGMLLVLKLRISVSWWNALWQYDDYSVYFLLSLGYASTEPLGKSLRVLKWGLRTFVSGQSCKAFVLMLYYFWNCASRAFCHIQISQFLNDGFIFICRQIKYTLRINEDCNEFFKARKVVVCTYEYAGLISYHPSGITYILNYLLHVFCKRSFIMRKIGKGGHTFAVV